MSDSVLLWNAVALEANRMSHTIDQGEQTGPTLSSRALAIVHLAIYNAYVGVKKPSGLLPYGTLPTAPAPGNKADEAIAGAAHTALVKLYPSQKPTFDTMLVSAGQSGSVSHLYGVAVAQAILADRMADPGAGSTTYKPSPNPGRHRPDPDNPGQGFHGPEYGRAPTFSATRRFGIAPPPVGAADVRYMNALREVRAKGIKPELMGTVPLAGARTPDETLIGLYWAYDGANQIGTPPRLYNQIVREVAVSRGNTVKENARLFALVNVAMADAGILGWHEKYRHDLWRPVLGIREHDRSLGPDAPAPDDTLSADCDTGWLPLGGPLTNRLGKNFTPPFPAYPSGHATFGAAALHMTRLFYGQGGRYTDSTGTIVPGQLGPDTLYDNLTFVSEECNGISRDNAGTIRPRHERSFPDGLWQMIDENGRSRVYLGVHWVFDSFLLDDDGQPDLYAETGGQPYGGVPLGLLIAENIFDAAGGGGPSKPLAAVVAPLADTEAADRTETNSSSYLP